jgi:MFS family permease
MSSSSLPSEEPSEPPLFTRDFALVLATHLTFGFAFSCFYLLPKFVVTELRGSASQVGYVGALSVVAAVAISPLCGRLVDRGGRRWLLFAGCALLALSGVAFLGVTSIGPYLYAVRALQGLAYSLYFVAGTTLVADLAAPSRLGQALGWFGAAGLLMNAIATVVAERIAQAFGWNAVFEAAALASVAAALLSLCLKAPQPARGRAAVRLPTQLGPQASRTVVLWAAAAGGAGFGVMFTFTQPLALSLGDTNISPLFTGYTLAALLIRVGFGNLGDRFGRARVSGGALVIYSLVVAATAGLTRGWLGPLGLGFGIAHGAFYPSLNALALEQTPPEKRGMVGAYFNAAFNVGTLLVTFCFGQIAERYGYPLVFLLVAVLTATGCFALLGLPRKPALARPS